MLAGTNFALKPLLWAAELRWLIISDLMRLSLEPCIGIWFLFPTGPPLWKRLVRNLLFDDWAIMAQNAAIQQKVACNACFESSLIWVTFLFSSAKAGSFWNLSALVHSISGNLFTSKLYFFRPNYLDYLKLHDERILLSLSQTSSWAQAWTYLLLL